ncbi:MAG TPA: ABC transporter substrate-binding protein, partial [Anaerolineaceae bacterium]|nr:ABC transporter substrate-binding protein [Anaerolineaceae bacterium]
EQLSEEERPDTLLLYYNETDGAVAFSVAPKNWIQTMLVEMAGGRPVWGEAQLEKGWMKVTLEQIAAWNPEVIVVTAYSLNIPEVVQKLNADPQFQALEAVKNGKFYGMAADVYSFDQPDTRWIMGVEWLAELLHPDRFPNFILTDAAEEFYRELYGMDKTSFQQNILPILTGTVK